MTGEHSYEVRRCSRVRGYVQQREDFIARRVFQIPANQQ